MPRKSNYHVADADWMRSALKLAARGRGLTTPNPMVGAVLVKHGKLIGQGWHHRAGAPHAEIEALRDAQRRGNSPRGADLYVTLEPCCTFGRTPPCTDAIIAARIKRVIVGATDPNPRHRGKAYAMLRKRGIQIEHGVLAKECERLNEAFNYWITTGTPFVTVKAAMTLDGKIATASGESKWITGEAARGWGMRLRRASDAILVGINTVIADDPSLTVRGSGAAKRPQPLRVVLDSMARTPLSAKIVTDEHADRTRIFVGPRAPKSRVSALAKRVEVIEAPMRSLSAPRGARRLRGSSDGTAGLDLAWVLKRLSAEQVTSVLVEGGGETNASILFSGLAQRIAFFFAPIVLGGKDSKPGVGGRGAESLTEALHLRDLVWRRLGPDLLLEAAL